MIGGIMKKLYLGLVLLIAFSLTACLGAKSYTYKLKNSKTESTVVLTAKGNKLVKYTTNTTVDYSKDITAAKYTIEQARAALKKSFDSLYNVNGIKYSFEYTDSKILKLKVDIDYTKANYRELAKRGLIDRADAKYIDFKATEKNLLSSGYKKEK
jgi:lipoprotein